MDTRRRIDRLAPLLALRRFVGAVVVLLALSIAAPRASAQFGMMGMGGELGDLMKPATNARLLKQYAEILGLTPDQKRAADELLIAYQADFRDSVTRLEEIGQSIQEEIQESGDWQLGQQALPSLMVKFMKKTEKLDTTFMSDLKSLLDDKQLARFDGVERLHRRKAAIKMGLEGEERIDLFDLVGGLRLESGAGTSAAATLEQYGSELDRELTARDKLIRSGLDDMAKYMEKNETMNEEPEFMKKWMKDMNDAGKRIGAVNSKYIPMVRAALPESAQADFDTQVKLAKYPAVYKKTYAARVFDAVDKMTDLDAGQKDGIKTLKDSYTRDAGAANDKLASVQDELKAGLSQDESMFGGGMWMVRQNPKYVEARDARKAIDDKAVDAVKALLNPAQVAKLPKKNYRPEWDFDRASNE